MATVSNDDPSRKWAQRVPTSWLGRSLRVAGTMAGVTARNAGGVMRRLLASDGDAQHISDAVAEKNALHLLDSLGRMKGALLKIGQMFSYMDIGLSPAARQILSALQDGAPPMAPEVIEKVVSEDLGRPPRELFAEFSREPLAAASIGQVHRARLQDGTEVVVKVQYPEIAEALKSDLRNAQFIALMARALYRGVQTAEVVDEIRSRLLEECDYKREADNQEEFRLAYAGHDDVVIPEVYRELSGARVLTTRFIDGQRFREFSATADQERRDRAGHAIFLLAYRSMFQHHAFNCDPHPGNYLFQGDGRVAFLDFGCVKRFEPGFIADCRRMMRAFLEGNRAGFDGQVVKLGFANSPKGYDFEYHRKLSAYLYRPWLHQRPFRFTPEYVTESYRLLVADNPNISKMNMPRDFVFVNRLQWGLNSVLADLRAESDWRQMMLSILYGPDEPLPLPWPDTPVAAGGPIKPG